MASMKAHAETMQPGPRVETVEEFLARGGRIERIEHYPDPEGRVLLRGWRESSFGPPLRLGPTEVHRR